MKLDTHTFRRAGLTPSDVHRLVGVSRVSVSHWFNGGGVHALIQSKVAALQVRVSAAVAAGLLPVQVPPRDKDARHAAIRQAITKAA
jgi:hypothetical protein